MTARRAQLIGSSLAAICLLLAGCSGHKSADAKTGSTGAGGSYDVDTAALRAQKAKAAIAPCPASRPDASATSDGLPAATLPCLGGGRDVNLAGLTGRPMVVNFWAQNCGPCRQESPVLQSMATRLAGKLRVIGVDFQDAQPGLALAFDDDLGITYPQLADPTGMTRAALRINALPTSFFVDGTGKVTHVETGPITSLDQFDKLLSTYLPAGQGGSR